MTVLNMFEAAVNSSSDAAGKSGFRNCVCIHGKHGTGKSALLEKLSNAMLMSGSNVFFSISQPQSVKQNETHGIDGAVRELLRQLARLYGSRHDPDFIKFILSYAKGTLTDDYENTDAYPYEKTSFIKFIFDCVTAEPIVLIIDDLDKADRFTINIINGLMDINALQFLVFSHSDKLENELLTQLLYRNANKIEYIQLRSDVNNDGSPHGSSQSQSYGPGAEDKGENIAALLDEAMLVLRQAGRERELIRFHMKNAASQAAALDYESAANTLSTAINSAIPLVDSAKHIVSSGDTGIYIDLLINLGDAQRHNRQFTEAIDSYRKAMLTAEHDSFKRAMASSKIAVCYEYLGDQDMVREYVMHTEAFFCTQERRAQHYRLYTIHIPRYLFILSELDEKIIFREKLKQAYSTCSLDDKEFTCKLYCEDAFMNMGKGDYDKARNLLLEALELSAGLSSFKSADEIRNALAICYGNMGLTVKSAELWQELAAKSYDPVRISRAKVNAALINYDIDKNKEDAFAGIESAINLCILAGENRIVSEIHENLTDTPLEGYLYL